MAKCITHHHACACREAEYRRTREALAVALRALRIVKANGRMTLLCDPADFDFDAEEAYETGAFNAGMMHVSVPKGHVSVHGTDGCMNCETGRITIYARSRYCIECQHKSEGRG